MDKFRLCKRFLYNIQIIEKVILSFSEDFCKKSYEWTTLFLSSDFSFNPENFTMWKFLTV